MEMFPILMQSDHLLYYEQIFGYLHLLDIISYLALNSMMLYF